ncbi:MAG: Heavy-metal resistance [Deltaproteobacteria bacterium]|nr:Heavy-metal resistance [Deltaproteobacteria bacterium]
MKRFLGVVVAVFLVVFATSVFAFGPGGGFGPGPKGAGHGIDLSKDQQDKMWQLKEKFNSDTSSLRYEMFQKRNELRTLYADPKATDAAILAKEKEVNTLMQKMHDRMVRFKLDQRKIYTPEQLKKLADRGGPGFGGRHHGPGGDGQGGCGF